ncbi:MAG TPA: FHA domain-containing protein [Thermoanaerobaculia bacterium]|nr:FHA domain-containing protein [Thermoanaerobaculia bacterium]
MPLIRCPKCGQGYDVPGVVAVRLPNSIATCHCGEWISGSKAAVLARLLKPDQIKEIDLQPYRVDAVMNETSLAPRKAEPAETPAAPRSIRVIARGAHESLNSVFTIGEHPLWIGRKGSHVELPGSELDIRHCSIAVRGTDLVVRDADSHMGTFLDGQKIKQVVIPDGVHLLRVGSALVSIEPTDEEGTSVEPVELNTNEFLADSAEIEAFRAKVREQEPEKKRTILVCIDGPMSGQEFEIPPTGLIVGREGHVRVNDEYLSRKHFEVFAESDGTIRVRDLGSRNGTFLNTLPAHNTKVQNGDEIRAGVHRFRVEHRA